MNREGIALDNCQSEWRPTSATAESTAEQCYSVTSREDQALLLLAARMRPRAPVHQAGLPARSGLNASRMPSATKRKPFFSAERITPAAEVAPFHREHWASSKALHSSVSRETPKAAHPRTPDGDRARSPRKRPFIPRYARSAARRPGAVRALPDTPIPAFHLKRGEPLLPRLRFRPLVLGSPRPPHCPTCPVSVSHSPSKPRVLQSSAFERFHVKRRRRSSTRTRLHQPAHGSPDALNQSGPNVSNWQVRRTARLSGPSHPSVSRETLAPLLRAHPIPPACAGLTEAASRPDSRIQRLAQPQQTAGPPMPCLRALHVKRRRLSSRQT